MTAGAMEPLVILVVDDDPKIRAVLARLLGRDERCRVVLAPDGLEALRVLEQEPVDLVLSDEVMPEINGVRLLETIRARWPAARRVLFTGHPHADVVMGAVNRGGVHRILVKGSTETPLADELAELVEETLALRTGGRPQVALASPSGTRAGVLVVAGEGARSRYESVLSGYDLRFASHEEGLTRYREKPADIVILDHPTQGGVRELLRALRDVDLDCPVVIASPRDGLSEAQDAMRYGAYRYLLHPFSDESLQAVVREAAALRRMARLRREAEVASTSGAWQLSDRAALEIRFRRALEQLFMVYQPIVSMPGARVIGYEALVRSREPTLPHPGALFDAARRLDRVIELGRAIRRISLDPFRDQKNDTLLFLNLDVADIDQADLLEPPMSSMAERIVLEVTERAALDSIDGLALRIAALRARGYRIAVDDLGAGYAGLTSFAMLEPDIVKLDMSLIRNVHQAPVKQRLVAGMQDACKDLHVRLVAEGVETREELASLAASGCEVFQGYLFARPGPPFPAVNTAALSP